ncbi:unnamed protein product [marine sediment metagenome]|uniref:C2H2-type domain-containing protein n=1 Tax=marine sediment metagenome TaxID=412755 RepID=X1EE17_9ZZZZ
MTFTRETYAILNKLRLKGENDDALIRRIVEYAKCYMVIKGAEDVEGRPYKCPFSCGKAYNRPHYLEIHLVEKHGFNTREEAREYLKRCETANG